MTPTCGVSLRQLVVRDLPGTYLARPPTAPAPESWVLNRGLAEVGVGRRLVARRAADLRAGNRLPAGAEPVAQAYAGHQFGGFSPQLGDGRALLLGEVVDATGRRWDIHFKGSGRTPFSRGGDGKAAVGPMLREYLMGEAMEALGIPTTRALAVVATGDARAARGGVARCRAGAGGGQPYPGGHVPVLSPRGGDRRSCRPWPITPLPGISPIWRGPTIPTLALFDQVIARQARLIAQWMGVGFIHGVMNTDNMAMSGETIDYGPCAFMDGYAPGTVFSSRSTIGALCLCQPAADPGLESGAAGRNAAAAVRRGSGPGGGQGECAAGGDRGPVSRRMGGGDARQAGAGGGRAGDGALVDELLAAMVQGADWTLTFRRLADAVGGDATGWRRCSRIRRRCGPGCRAGRPGWPRTRRRGSGRPTRR